MKDEGQRTYITPPVLDEGGLVAFLRTQPDVVAAYLFGSLAQGKATPRSDIDIAVLLTRPPDYLSDGPQRQFQLMDHIRHFTDRDIDLVILNTAPPILKNQVLRYGRRLYEGDRRARVEFEVRTGQEFADLQPMYDFFKKDLLLKIREVGLSGRRRSRHRTTTDPC